ncbi:O-methyltransferase-domain-containing protein [Aspergillus tetrazonus]
MAATAQNQSEEVAVDIKTNATVHNREMGPDDSVLIEDSCTPDTFDNEIVIRPNAPQDLPALLTEYLDAARRLVYSLETPREAMVRYCWSQSTIYAAIETCVDLGVFVSLSKDDTPKTVAELAKATHADPLLLSRLLKHLSTMGIIVETSEDTYRCNGFSTSLSNKRYSDAYPCMLAPKSADTVLRTNYITYGITSLPSFPQENQLRQPKQRLPYAFQDGYRTDKHFFELLKEHPTHGAEFNNHMTAYRQGRPSWMDDGFYPVPSLTEGLNIGADDVLLVDVGGNWPSIPGRLVLQDLPGVIKQEKWQNQDTQETIEPMSHDFFTEQPVKAYYMHSVLHDWADADCRRILSNLVSAMKRGYSKILIKENVIPSNNAYWETTSLDIIMIADFASQERTEKQWHALVESVGLMIVKIWTRRRGVENLIECELA